MGIFVSTLFYKKRILGLCLILNVSSFYRYLRKMCLFLLYSTKIPKFRIFVLENSLRGVMYIATFETSRPSFEKMEKLLYFLIDFRLFFIKKSLLKFRI